MQRQQQHRRLAHGRTRGFTIFEVVIAMSLIGLALGSLAPLFTSNHNLVEDTRALQRAESEHRRNMVALSRVLRGVDSTTLGGFDNSGTADSPSFGRVTGADLDDLTYVGDERLSWMPAPIAVDGVQRPGAVYLLRDGRRFLVADRVPQGGFHVRREGQGLVIHLKTYYTTNTRRVVERSSETIVAMRN